MKNIKKKNKTKKNITKKNKTKKNKKLYLQKGGAKTWNEYFKNSPQLQGPYNSSGLEKFFNYLSSWGSSWGSYMMNFNPYVIIAKSASAAAEQVSNKVFEVYEKNKNKLMSNIPKIPTEIPEIPKVSKN